VFTLNTFKTFDDPIRDWRLNRLNTLQKTVCFVILLRYLAEYNEW